MNSQMEDDRAGRKSGLRQPLLFIEPYALA